MFKKKTISDNLIKAMIRDEIVGLRHDIENIDADTFQMRLWLVVDKIDLFKAVFGNGAFEDEEKVLFGMAGEAKFRQDLTFLESGERIDVEGLEERLGLGRLGRTHVVGKNEKKSEGTLVCGEILREQVDCLYTGRSVDEELRDFLSYVDRKKGMNNAEKLMLKVYLRGKV